MSLVVDMEAGFEHVPLRTRPDLTLGDYWRAPSDSMDTIPSQDWRDKPHRLIYDLLAEIIALHKELEKRDALDPSGQYVSRRGIQGSC